MDYQQRVNAFSKLGEWLSDYLSATDVERATTEFAELSQAIERACQKNKWFTPTSCHLALSGIIQLTNRATLNTWLNSYEMEMDEKTIGVVMAGNIPLVGFHDFLCVLISGHHLQCKLSSDDDVLLPVLIKKLCELEAGFESCIQLCEKHLSNYDAVIATGSTNTSIYFEYYFGKYPHIIRKNRNGVAVLNGEETTEDINKLGNDIFSYYGLGCRNVSKIYVPMGYDLSILLEGLTTSQNLLEHNKYHNNYQYNKILYTMKKIPVLDSGFVVLVEEVAIASPIGVLYYENYKEDDLPGMLQEKEEAIQCVVAGSQLSDAIPFVPFGKAQFPEVDDYADGVDTMAFLSSL